MADNISVTPGTGVTVSGDDVGGVLFQRVKVSLGNDGIFDGDVSATNPIPATITSSALPSGASTATLQSDGNASLVSIDTKLTDQATAAKQDLLLAELELKADLTETQPVSLASVPLAPDAATETTLAALEARTPGLGQAVMASSTPVVIASNQTTLPVSAASLPLPAGGSTSALQTTGNNSLASIDAGIPNALGTAVIASSMPVNIASDQVVPISATALPLPTGAATSALQGTGNTSLSSIDTKLSSQATAAKQDLLLAELQLKADLTETQPVSLASIPLASGAATAANQTTTNASLASIDAGIPNALGAAVTASSMPVNIASDQVVPISAASLPLPTGAASATNQTTTNNSLASIDTKTPALGQAVMASSSPVVIASNQSAVSVQPQDAVKTSYTASIQGLVVGATPTDIFTITGSATAVIKIRHVAVSAFQTTSSMQSVSLIKRSTANTGGTSTTPTNVSHDSADSAATATVRAYTANPTLGTTVGRLAVKKFYVSGAIPANNGQFAPGNIAEFVYDQQGQKPIILRGTSEVIAVNLPGVTLTGNSFDIFVEWTEE